MPSLLAGVLVFFTSAAILVLEILAGRLLAPYVGVTLETYTAVIGTVLAGISLGTWLGGALADRVEPRRLLGPMLILGGALSLASVPVVRAAGAAGSGSGDSGVIGLAFLGFFAPAAVLSAVSPTVVKVQLRDLTVTGHVVGRLSALGTAGAIVGTFVAGFVLVAAAATTTVIVAVGTSLILAGAALWATLGRAPRRSVGAATLAAFAMAAPAAALRSPCDVETRYHCARVVEEGGGGRLLMLDTLRHSYVDLDDPEHLEFRYTKVFADVAAVSAGGAAPRALHIGGGGFTMPRYLAATRPASRHTVLEIDGDLVQLAHDRLDAARVPRLDVRVGDARTSIRGLPDGGHDLVFGDAFGGPAVPWHLTTTEFVREVRRTLADDGVYVLNVIDYPPLRFARAEVATLLAVFRHVAVLAPGAVLDGADGGNVVLVGSDAPIDGAELEARVRRRGGEEEVLVDAAAARFAAGAEPLTDDYAPVDQWLVRSRRPAP